MPSERRPFQYRERSRDALQERANRRAGGFDSYIKSQYKRYKVREGKNVIRVLPPTWEDANHYGYDIYANYGIGVDNQSYLSLSMMAKKHPELGLDGRDPIAEARKQAERDDDEELIKQLKPRDRVVMFVIDRLDEDEGPQIFDCPFTVDKDFCNLCLDEDTKEIIYHDNPDEGYDIRFYREGTGLNTKYPASKMKLLGPSPLSEDKKQQKEWLNFVEANPIPNCLQIYDYDHIAAVFDGKVSKKDDDDEKPAPKKATRPADDDEDETPPPRRRRVAIEEDEEPPAKAKKPAKDEDDEPPFEEDEGPKRPSIRDRLKARTPKSDDEDDDE